MTHEKIKKNIPISPLPEEDYCMGKASKLTLRPLIANGLFDEYLWFRDYFIQYAKTQKNKPYHSHFFSLFQNAVFYTPYADNRTKRRILNFYKNLVKANLEITSILQDDTAKVVFAKPFVNHSENIPIVKALKGTESVVKAFVTNVACSLEKPIINIGPGLVNHVPDSEPYDIMQGKDINELKQEKLELSTFVSNQSIYHIRPDVLERICKRPFVGSYTIKEKYMCMADDYLRKSGRIGLRNYFNEFFYHPRFFVKRGFIVYSPAHSTSKYLCFCFSNILRPPRHIPFKASAEVDIEPYGVIAKEKLPLMVDVRNCEPNSMAATTCYHSQKIDGIFAKLRNDNGSLTLHSRHGFKYKVLNVSSNMVNEEFFVEVLIDEERRKAKVFFLMKRNGSYLWEDVREFLSFYPIFGNKSYFLVPNYRVFQMQFDPIPHDGVVYTPVMSFTGNIPRAKNEYELCTHWYLKALPTYDVSYNAICDLRRSGKDVQIYENGEYSIMHDKHYYQAHGEFMDQNPFIYEVSIMQNQDKTLRYFVHHTRLDKKKVQDILPASFPYKPENEKGVFYFSKLGSDYGNAIKNFFKGFSDKRRFISPDLIVEKENYFYSVLRDLSKGKYVLQIGAVDLYKILMVKYTSYMSMMFIKMAIKSPHVGKIYNIKRNKINCDLIFNRQADDSLDLDILFGERKHRNPSTPLK